jgi:hypothetical protein
VTPEELDALLGAYALDAVDPDERIEIEEYLAANPRARAEVDQHQEVAAMLAFSGSAAPDGIWDRISSAIGGDSANADGDDAGEPAVPSPLQLVMGGPGVGSPKSRSRAPWYALGGLAAAAAVIVFVLVGMVNHRNNEISASRAPDVKAAAQAALASPDTRKVSLVSSDGHERVEVAVSPDGTGFGVAQGLPSLPSDRTYQLWGQFDGQVVSLGLLGQSPTAIAFPAATGLKALLITEEQAAGVVATHQTPVVQGSFA